MLLCCITYVGANNLLGIGGLARLGSTRYRTAYIVRVTSSGQIVVVVVDVDVTYSLLLVLLQY